MSHSLYTSPKQQRFVEEIGNPTLERDLKECRFGATRSF